MRESPYLIIVIFLLAVVGGYLVTRLFLGFAEKSNIIDIPNDRSSHHLPTPSGGGVGFVIPLALGMFLLFITGSLGTHQVWVYSPIFALSIIGYMDDRFHLPILWRLTSQVLVVMLVLGSITLFSNIQLDLSLVRMGGYLIVGLYLLWMINLFNFMDGIDGIAAVQAITVIGGSLILMFGHFTDQDIGDLYPHLLLCGAVLGFLIWNWAPAKIFMGDTGSLLLGAWVGVASIELATKGWMSVYPWLILMAVFITDASMTLFARLAAGERFYQAHRSHAYQCASRRLGHRYVVVCVIGINVLWLFPIAWGASRWVEWEVVLTFIAYIPLLLLQVLIRQTEQLNGE